MNVRDKRSVCDGDKFQIVFATKNGDGHSLRQRSNGNWSEMSYFGNGRQSLNSASVIAEVQNQTPLVFIDDDNNNVEEEVDVKPVSIEFLISVTIACSLWIN